MYKNKFCCGVLSFGCFFNLLDAVEVEQQAILGEVKPVVCFAGSQDLTTTQTNMFRDIIVRLKEQYDRATQTGVFNISGFFAEEKDPEHTINLALCILKDECNAHVKTISLENNNIKSLPLIGKFTDVKNLFLSNNPFVELPKELIHLKNLEYLEANRCDLTRYPAEVNKLKGLKKLFLQENKISLVPSAIRKLRKLEELDLSNNKILDIPGSIGELEQLVILKLNNNELTSLPAQLENLKYLKFISVHGNLLDKEAIDLLVRLQKRKVTVRFDTSVTDKTDH